MRSCLLKRTLMVFLFVMGAGGFSGGYLGNRMSNLGLTSPFFINLVTSPQQALTRNSFVNIIT